jgi:hypothetical protein
MLSWSCSATRTRCCAARPGPVPVGRPGVLRRAGTAHALQALGQNLPNYASDVAGLAPQAGREQVRHEQMAHARPPAGSPGASTALSFAWRRIHGFGARRHTPGCRRPPGRSGGQRACIAATAPDQRSHGRGALGPWWRMPPGCRLDSLPAPGRRSDMGSGTCRVGYGPVRHIRGVWRTGWQAGDGNDAAVPGR